jgi:hypothetical protein
MGSAGGALMEESFSIALRSVKPLVKLAAIS